MSEYQYYEFLAIDRPFSTEARKVFSSLSSRAEGLEPGTKGRETLVVTRPPVPLCRSKPNICQRVAQQEL